VLDVNLTGEGWDAVRLRQFAANDVVRALKTVPGVQQVVPFGGLQRQLRVVADRTALAAQGMSLLDVRDALDRQNLSRSGGTITGGDREILVRGDQRVGAARDVLQYPLRARGNRVIRIADVATVEDGAAERRSAYRFNGIDGVEISVIEEPEASSPRVIAALDAKLSEIERANPGLHFTRAYDNSRFVSTLSRNMIEELIVSVVLAGLVLLIFLEDVSATAIVMTSIPTCLGLAILLFAPFGLSINSSTLVGLLLAIGRLVDDSIVVIHAVHRKLDEGRTPAQAAVEGTAQVFLPIAAATGVMTLAVVPLLTSGGITQIMFVGLVWPIVFALLASLAVSITLTPLLAASLFPHRDAPPSPWRTRVDGAVRRVLAPARRALNDVDVGYRRALRWALDNRWIVLGGGAIATYLAFAAFGLIGSEMMPLADTAQAYAQLDVLPGASFAATDAKAKAFERILLAQPEVERVSGQIGEAPANGYLTGGAMNGATGATYAITFKTKEERRRSIWQILDAVHDRALREIPGIRRLALKEMGSDVMATSEAPVELIVYGPDLAALHGLAARVAAIARSVPGMVQVGTSASLTDPEVRIEVDRFRAAQLGLSPSDIQAQAYYAMHGGLTTEFANPENVRHEQILVRYAGPQRATVADLDRVQIVGSDGQAVPLLSVARVVRDVGPTLIEHDGLRRSVSILGYYRKGGPGEMSLDMQTMMGALAAIPFPHGYGIAMRGDMTEMMQSFDRLVRAMELSIVFVFLLLVAQFRSAVQPLVMLLAIPLQLAGVVGGLLIAHQAFSTVSILGIVVANGMAVSNAILLLDLILAKRREGLSVRDAILVAGPIRLRPILMTTIVSLIVLSPVAFFPQTGIDAYAPLATVIIGGLTVSTVLTLFVVPVLHDAFAELSTWRAARRQQPAAEGA
jgi:multidrug efflux pump subunit AcrB